MMRIYFKLFFVSLLLFSSHAQAEETPLPPSLFFTPQQAQEAEMLADKAAPAGAGNIRLGAVMYYNDDDWVLWLQGERWTPETSREDLRITKVSADQVHLLWRGDDGQSEEQIVLRPNQTFQIATGKILTAP